VAFMQKLPGDRYTQAELAAFRELNHTPNCLTPMFPIEASIVRKTGECYVKHFLHRAVQTAGQLPTDDLLLLGFKFDGHIFNVAPSAESCNRGRSNRGRSRPSGLPSGFLYASSDFASSRAATAVSLERVGKSSKNSSRVCPPSR
jgi:hypothetical protein